MFEGVSFGPLVLASVHGSHPSSLRSVFIKMEKLTKVSHKSNVQKINGRSFFESRKRSYMESNMLIQVNFCCIMGLKDNGSDIYHSLSLFNLRQIRQKLKMVLDQGITPFIFSDHPYSLPNKIGNNALWSDQSAMRSLWWTASPFPSFLTTLQTSSCTKKFPSSFTLRVLVSSMSLPILCRVDSLILMGFMLKRKATPKLKLQLGMLSQQSASSGVVSLMGNFQSTGTGVSSAQLSNGSGKSPGAASKKMASTRLLFFPAWMMCIQMSQIFPSTTFLPMWWKWKRLAMKSSEIPFLVKWRVERLKGVERLVLVREQGIWLYGSSREETQTRRVGSQEGRVCPFWEITTCDQGHSVSAVPIRQASSRVFNILMVNNIK